MAKLEDRDLMRYHDGELGERRSRRVREQIDADEAAAARLAGLEEVGDLLRSATDSATDDAVDDRGFDAMWAAIERGIEDEPRPSTSERLGIWLRRHWVAATSAVAAAAVAVVIMVPLLGSAQSNDCDIEQLDTGPGAVSTIFKISDPGSTSSTTVIWVNEAQGDDD
ncbi:MAG: hypothetical protein KC503_27270 [Myxococcales bacterium]|nr:hypothetical protein [Myxococcales bacterium]